MSRIMLSSATAAASALVLAALLTGCTEDASPETGAASRLSATEPDRRGPPRDHDHDRRRDDDGDRPSKAERAARREAMHAQMLARFDADHDGALSADERAAAHRARVGEMIAKLDADGNGTLSSTEFAAMPKRGPHGGPDFATLDQSGDGALSLDELLAARPPGPPPGRPPGDVDDDGPPPPE